jgi:L-alanine-DL-glutamate epimerase-like enolase superfamily enzyme
VSAVDCAIWDLHARLRDESLVSALGRARDAVPIYGSGGFTSYDIARLQTQLAGWVDRGIPRVKMKVGRDADADRTRVRAAREAIGAASLFVDANGGYSAKQALAQAYVFAESGVSWFEEPVSSDDLAGLRELRTTGPPGMDVAAGEYGFAPWYFRQMLEARAVDCLQADATRCLGITGFRIAAELAFAFGLPFSAHCAPSIHAHPACSVPEIRHLEYFHDHTRLESMLFDGVLEPRDGTLAPDRTRPGNGLELRRADADRYRI